MGALGNPKFQKRHYEAAVELIDRFSTNLERVTHPFPEHKNPTREDICSELVNEFSGMFYCDNVLFNRDKFIEALQVRKVPMRPELGTEAQRRTARRNN